ncbi:MAG TPA: transglycosylase family protein, partial [Acidimicrobiales bacterium]|nr:transglycosylase family protein [Acidimicrobiales bacterium]
RTARRAVVGAVAGIALLVGPVALANVIVPGDDDQTEKVEASAASDTSLVALRQSASQQDSARAQGLLSMRTTTTTAPPTTTTTAPPTTTTTEAPTTTTTEAPPPPAEDPAPPSTGGGFGDPGDYATWDALAQCESGGRWDYSAGPYYGGLQFSESTWHSVGGTGMPYEHSRETQIHFGQILQARSGWGQWPHCSSELGLR